MSAMHAGVGAFLIAVIAAPGGATGHLQQPPGPPTTAAAEVTQCAQAQMVVDRLLAAAMLRLDSARQSNAATDLRAAVDSLQNTMRDARAQLAPCAATSASADPHAGHTVTPAASPGAKAKAPADHSTMPMGNDAPVAKPAKGAKPFAPVPVDHSKMPMGNALGAKPASAEGSRPDAPAQAVDPVCGLNVDPGTAPQATHQGRIHYFCSEQHRQLFQKSPSKYLPKGK